MFHYIRTAALLLHPLAPEGTEMLREYLGFGEDFWSWDHVFEGMDYFCKGESEHQLKFLEPRVDFFKSIPHSLQAVKKIKLLHQHRRRENTAAVLCKGFL